MAKLLTLEAGHRIRNMMDRQPVEGNIKLLREGRPREGEDEGSLSAVLRHVVSIRTVFLWRFCLR